VHTSKKALEMPKKKQAAKARYKNLSLACRALKKEMQCHQSAHWEGEAQGAPIIRSLPTIFPHGSVDTPSETPMPAPSSPGERAADLDSDLEDFLQ